MLPVAIAVLVFPVWTVYREWRDRAPAPRLPATIAKIFVNRSSGTRLPIHDYELWVHYPPDEWTELRTMSYRQYRVADAIFLLRNPKTGRLEVDPFPDWWIVGGLLSAFSMLPFLLFFLSSAVLRQQRAKRSGSL
jgi:hypothetical protein